MGHLLWRAVRASPYATAVHLLCALAASATLVAQPAVLASAIDAATAGHALTAPLLLLALIFAIGLAGRALGGWAGSVVGLRAIADLRRTLIRHALLLGTPHQQPFNVGDLVSRVGVDAGMPGALLAIATEVGLGVSVSTAALVALGFTDWPTALAVVAGGAALLVVVRRFVADLSEPMTRYQTHRGEVATRLLDACRGARTIRASGTLAREVARVLAPLKGLRDAADAQWRAQRHLVARMTVLNHLLQVVIIAVAGLRLAAGALTPGQALAAIAYANLALGLLDQVDVVRSLVLVRAGVTRVREVLDHPPALAPPALAPLGPPAAKPTGPGALCFEQVGLLSQIRDVSLDIPGGTRVAVVGRSGAGKSALCAVAGRLADPDAGRVLLDGVPLPQIDPDHLRRRIAYAFERPELFGTTVRDAIAAGRPATVDRIETAARAARAAHFIECLPLGYDTPVADLALSGGEIQRLGIARALFGEADVLLLDDATSSLDTATEMELLDVLHKAWAGRTAVIVAHRATTAAAADTVVWLDEGRVRRIGTHHDLEDEPEYRVIFGASLVEAAA